MKYIQANFADGQNLNLCPPDNYPNWTEYEEESWGDLYETNGIWIKNDDGSTELIAQDGGEPEDNSFDRDGCWIVGELNKAFRLGFETGYNNAYGEMQINEGLSP